MFYVYSRNIKSGREEFVGIYNTEKDAIHRIAFLYKLDTESTTHKDEYYYFYKKH